MQDMTLFEATNATVRWIILPYAHNLPAAFTEQLLHVSNADTSFLIRRSSSRLSPKRHRAYPVIIEPCSFALDSKAHEELKRAVHKKQKAKGNHRHLSFLWHGDLVPFTLQLEVFATGHFTIQIDAAAPHSLTAEDLISLSTLPKTQTSGISHAIAKDVAMLSKNDIDARLELEEAKKLDFKYYPIIHITQFTPRNESRRIVEDVPWNVLAQIGTRHEDIDPTNLALVEPYRQKNYTIRDDVLVVDAQSMLIVSPAEQLEYIQIQHSVRTALHLSRLLTEFHLGQLEFSRETFGGVLDEINQIYALPDRISPSETYRRTFPLILDRFRIVERIKAELPRVLNVGFGSTPWPNVAADSSVCDEHRDLARTLFSRQSNRWVSIRLERNGLGRSQAATYMVETFTTAHERGRPFVVKVNDRAEFGTQEESKHKLVQTTSVRVPLLLDSLRYSTQDGKELHGMLFEFAGSDESVTTLGARMEQVFHSPLNRSDTDKQGNDASHGSEIAACLAEVFRAVEPMYRPRPKLGCKWDDFKLLGASRKKLENIKGRDSDRFGSDVFHAKLQLPISAVNPLQHMEDLAKRAKPVRFKACWSSVHGDLHPGNVLINQNATCWVIDFLNFSEGHFYRDFTRLEAELRGACISYTERDAASLLAIESLAIQQEDFFYETIRLADRASASVRSSIECARAIRQHCQRILLRHNQTLRSDEYLFSLFANVVGVGCRDETHGIQFEFLMTWGGYLAEAADRFVASQ